jgi:hypothetical protein
MVRLSSVSSVDDDPVTGEAERAGEVGFFQHLLLLSRIEVAVRATCDSRRAR